MPSDFVKNYTFWVFVTFFTFACMLIHRKIACRNRSGEVVISHLNINIPCERRGSKRGDLTVESFFLQSTTRNLGNYWIFVFIYLIELIFLLYNRYACWTGPAMTLFYGNCLSQFKVKKLEILTQFGYQFQHFKAKILFGFEILSFIVKQDFCHFFKLFCIIKEP